MTPSEIRSVEDFIRELNDNSDASFEELANKIDVWASQAGATRQEIIELICTRCDRDAEQRNDSRPVQTGEFIDYPVVVFSPAKEEA
ncbi:hypothetical protein [Leisingera sp. F5]|uniref:hypothetical protein n=1 Tax=Leisingera sp. F5 TaxID=1813816 RepID=UPI000A42C926|nr:hypothetical protein [Leisingera sp. F5]